ncbi:uncharacterized protein BDV14DRAFT_200514 [Aspergillus stella-maris]|uniref:uncharacterized protein n=1 Tax=Aspergillus stella-maris TaxID=1810926 RepID=UPI003CCD2CCA
MYAPKFQHRNDAPFYDQRVDRAGVFTWAPPPRVRPLQYESCSARSTTNYVRHSPLGPDPETYGFNSRYMPGAVWSNDRSHQATYSSPSPPVETLTANFIPPPRSHYDTDNRMAMGPGRSHVMVTHLTQPSHQPYLAGFHGYSDASHLPIGDEYLEYIDGNGVRRFKCLIDGCTQRGGFKHKGCLTRHQKTKHVHPGSHMCLFCFKIFDRNDNLQAHMKRKHPQSQ